MRWKGARDRICYSSTCISLDCIDNWNNWAVVVVKYDPVLCCVLHAQVHQAARHHHRTQTSPPPPPPDCWRAAAQRTGTTLFQKKVPVAAYLYTARIGTEVAVQHEMWASIIFCYEKKCAISTAITNIKTTRRNQRRQIYTILLTNHQNIMILSVKQRIVHFEKSTGLAHKSP